MSGDADAMVPADDERVLQYRRDLAAADGWANAGSGYEGAICVVAALRERLEKTPEGDALAAVFYTGRGTGGSHRLPIALARVLRCLGPAFMDAEHIETLATGLQDATLRKGPLSKRTLRRQPLKENKLLLHEIRKSILAAHYLAARDGRKWLEVHAEIILGVGDSTRYRWAKSVPLKDRRLAKMAGNGNPLVLDREDVREIMRLNPDEIRDRYLALRR